MSIFVSVCTFKRTGRSEIEFGVAIGSDESTIQTIVDGSGDRVGTIYDYTCRPARGCFQAEIPANGLKPVHEQKEEGK
jgi:hypothetical protein